MSKVYNLDVGGTIEARLIPKTRELAEANKGIILESIGAWLMRKMVAAAWGAILAWVLPYLVRWGVQLFVAWLMSLAQSQRQATMESLYQATPKDLKSWGYRQQ